jgi:penicillin amidase
MRRLAVNLAGALALAAVAACVGGYAFLRRSLPEYSGTVSVSALTAPVEIIRDADNVPHIFAAAKDDALFGLGWVHAQDRLWQMEFQRRVGHGRLSEVFGEATLAQDRFLRTLGTGRAARAAWDRLPEEARRAVDAYVAGVNAFLSTHTGSLRQPELVFLGIDPEPWTGPDVLVWAKMMAWDLSANYSHELLRRDLTARVGAVRMAELTPPYPVDGLSIVKDARSPLASWAPLQGHRTPLARGPDATIGAAAMPWLAAFAQAVSKGHPQVRDLLLGGAWSEALGSNSWVVHGSLTKSGSPILANDPHLNARIPSIWYLAHLSAGELDVIGATVPGTPAVAIGRNRSIAWGATNVGADVQDLYLERLDPSGTRAEFRGSAEPLRIVEEAINVRSAPPVPLTVRITRHGPLVSDAINANRAGSRGAGADSPLDPFALRWTALDPDDPTIAAFLRLNEARGWSGFTAALRDFVVPAQNFVYADVDGHIGYYAPGRIPMRANGDGAFPTEGWTGHTEWTGWVPFEELPHAFDPPEGFIVAANNRPVSPPYSHFIALEYPEPYRAERIAALIRDARPVTTAALRSIQADTHSLHARTLVPLLLEHASPTDTIDSQAIQLLRAWDFDARGDSAAAAIFQAWFLQLAPALAGDELGPVVLDSYEGRLSYVTRFIVNTLTSDNSPWCDDVATPARETCRDIVTAALHEGVAELSRRMGANVSAWRWDEVHRVVFPHQGFDALGLVRPIFSRSVPGAGDWSTVNVGTVSVDRPFDQRAVPSYRQIVDLSPGGESRFIDAVGQSGHFLSRHYDDFLDDWRAVAGRPMRMDRAEIERGATGRLRLVPAAE